MKKILASLGASLIVSLIQSLYRKIRPSVKPTESPRPAPSLQRVVFYALLGIGTFALIVSWLVVFGFPNPPQLTLPKFDWNWNTIVPVTLTILFVIALIWMALATRKERRQAATEPGREWPSAASIATVVPTPPAVDPIISPAPAASVVIPPVPPPTQSEPVPASPPPTSEPSLPPQRWPGQRMFVVLCTLLGFLLSTLLVTGLLYLWKSENFAKVVGILLALVVLGIVTWVLVSETRRNTVNKFPWMKAATVVVVLLLVYGVWQLFVYVNGLPTAITPQEQVEQAKQQTPAQVQQTLPLLPPTEPDTILVKAGPAVTLNAGAEWSKYYLFEGGRTAAIRSLDPGVIYEVEAAGYPTPFRYGPGMNPTIPELTLVRVRAVGEKPVRIWMKVL